MSYPRGHLYFKYGEYGDRVFRVFRPWWGTPLLVRFWAWEVKLSTPWGLDNCRPWKRDFWDSPYPWRPCFRRYVGGTGRLCEVWTFGWLSVHRLESEEANRERKKK